MQKKLKCEIYNDNFQNYKKYPIQKAQLVIADIPYNIGTNFYGSNPMWYNGGTMPTVRVNWQVKRHSIQILTSTSLSILHSAIGC